MFSMLLVGLEGSRIYSHAALSSLFLLVRLVELCLYGGSGADATQGLSLAAM